MNVLTDILDRHYWIVVGVHRWQVRDMLHISVVGCGQPVHATLLQTTLSCRKGSEEVYPMT